LSEELHPAQVRADKTNSAPCGEIVSPYFGPSDGDKKESRWQNQGKRKPLLTKMTTFQKSRKVRKTGQSEKAGLSQERRSKDTMCQEIARLLI
jgi:hypothetical protein